MNNRKQSNRKGTISGAGAVDGSLLLYPELQYEHHAYYSPPGFRFYTSGLRLIPSLAVTSAYSFPHLTFPQLVALTINELFLLSGDNSEYRGKLFWLFPGKDPHMPDLVYTRYTWSTNERTHWLDATAFQRLSWCCADSNPNLTAACVIPIFVRPLLNILDRALVARGLSREDLVKSKRWRQFGHQSDRIRTHHDCSEPVDVDAAQADTASVLPVHPGDHATAPTITRYSSRVEQQRAVLLRLTTKTERWTVKEIAQAYNTEMGEKINERHIGILLRQFQIYVPTYLYTPEEDRFLLELKARDFGKRGDPKKRLDEWEVHFAKEFPTLSKSNQAAPRLQRAKVMEGHAKTLLIRAKRDAVSANLSQTTEREARRTYTLPQSDDTNQGFVFYLHPSHGSFVGTLQEWEAYVKPRKSRAKVLESIRSYPDYPSFLSLPEGSIMPRRINDFQEIPAILYQALVSGQAVRRMASIWATQQHNWQAYNEFGSSGRQMADGNCEDEGNLSPHADYISQRQESASSCQPGSLDVGRLNVSSRKRRKSSAGHHYVKKRKNCRVP